MSCTVLKHSSKRWFNPTLIDSSRFACIILFFLLLLPQCSGTSLSESTLSDCRTIEPFSLQNRQSTDSLNSTGEKSEACHLRPGTTAVMLLGSADVRLQSPMRTLRRATEAGDVTMDGSHTEHNDGVIYSFFRSITQMLGSLWAYPWVDPTATERFFLVRHLDIRFELAGLANSANLDNDASRAHLFNTAAFDRIRLISFTPIVSPDPVGLMCDYATVLSAQRTDMNSGHFVLTVISSLSALVFHSSSQKSFSSSAKSRNPTGVYVVEELGPYRGSGLWLPSWLAVWFGRRPLAVSEAFAERNEKDEHGNNVSHVELVFSAQMPAVTSACLRLSVAEESSVIVRIEESVSFDSFWLQIILLLCLVRYVQPWIEESQTLQIFVAGLGSVVVICCFVIIFILRKLQDMTLGKIGLFTLLAIGGFSAAAEGIMSALGAVVRTYVRRYEDLLPHTIMGLLLLGVSCGLFAKFLWASYLTALTQWTMRMLQMSILLAAILQNCEATLILLVVAFVLRPSFLFRFIIWCSRSHALENFENDPQEVFPQCAGQEVPYAQPLCVEGLSGSTRGLNSEQKLYLYNVMGDIYTQQALTQLSEQVRRDPDKYATRLQDPKGVSRWANSFK